MVECFYELMVSFCCYGFYGMLKVLYVFKKSKIEIVLVDVCVDFVIVIVFFDFVGLGVYCLGSFLVLMLMVLDNVLNVFVVFCVWYFELFCVLLSGEDLEC